MPFDKNMKVQNPNPNKHSNISIFTLINYSNDSSYQFQKQAIDILDSLRKQGIVDDHTIEKAKKTEKESGKDRVGEDGVKQDDEILQLSDNTILTKDILNTPNKLKVVEQNKDNLNFLPLIQYIDEEQLFRFADSDAPQIRKAVAEKIPVEQLNMFYGETVDTVLDVVAERIPAVDGDKLLKKNNNLTFAQTEKIIKKVNEFNDFAKELQDAEKISPELLNKINKLEGSDFDYAMEQIRPKLADDKEFNFTKSMEPKKLTKYFSDEVETDSQWNPDYEIQQEDKTGKVKVYRGGSFKDGRGYVSLEPGFAVEFGDIDEWEIDKNSVLDLTNPVHRIQVQARFGDEVLNQLSPDNELPSAGNGDILNKLEKVSKSLGFIASAQSEGEGLPTSFDVYDANKLNFPTPERVSRKSIFGSSPAEVEESLGFIAKNNYEGLLDIATEANDEENPLFSSNPKLREKIATSLKPEDVPIFSEDTDSQVRMQVAKKIVPKLASEYGSSESDPDVLAEYILKMHEKDVTDSMMYHESNVVRRAVSEIIENPVLLERSLKNEITYDRADFTTLYNVVDKFKPEQIKSIVYPLYEKSNNWDLKNVIARTITPDKIKNEQDFSNYADFIKPGTDFKILSNLAKVVPEESGSKYFNQETVQKIFDNKRSSDIDISSFVKELLPKQEVDDVLQNVNKYVDYIAKYGGDGVVQAVTNSKLIQRFKDAGRIDDYNNMLDSIVSYSDNPMIPKYSHTPVKVEDTDDVYVYRTISQGELDNILNGQDTGEFWTSAPQSYPVGSRGNYRIVAKSEGKSANWLGGYLRPENTPYDVRYEGLNAIRVKNDNFKSPSKQKNHFEEIGGKNINNIVAIYDADGNEIYNTEKEIKKEYDEIKSKYTTDGKLKYNPDSTFHSAIAPNGNTSNLNEQQWIESRSKRFKSWFGDWENDPVNASKVVDENGEPKPVYHGSLKQNGVQFNKFDNEMAEKPHGKSAGNVPHAFLGSYFTPDDTLAEMFGTRWTNTSLDKVFGVKPTSYFDRDGMYRLLSFSNKKDNISDLNELVDGDDNNSYTIKFPLYDSANKEYTQLSYGRKYNDKTQEFDEIAGWYISIGNKDYTMSEVDESFTKKIVDMVNSNLRTYKDYYQKNLGDVKTYSTFLNIKHPKIYDSFEELINDFGSMSPSDVKKIKTKWKEYGYDGVYVKKSPIYFRDKNAEQYISFDSNQIKSTDENKGTFNKFSDDIRYQVIEDNDNKVITYKQAEDIVRKYFSEDEIDIKKSMRLFVENRAFGSYVNQVISFIENPDISTPYHESVHAYLDNFYTYEEKQDIYDAIREKDNAEYTDTQAEEKLADLFYPYVKGKETVTGKLKDYFDKAINFIKSLVGKEDKIKKLFSAIESGKRPASNVKDITSNPIFQAQMEYYQTPKYLTTKLFKMVETQKEYISKQEVSDLIKSKRANLKKPERELLNRILHDNFRMDGKIKVEDFENAVIQNLLPLNRKVSSKYADYGMEHLGGYWNDGVDSQNTHIYESPEPNGVGGHFDGETDSLFGHTRIWSKDNIDHMAEIQSDYFQKYRDALYKNPELMPFKNTWHERMIREEIRNSAVKGSESLRFPHPFTVAVIEGYVSGRAPYVTDNGDDYVGHGTGISYLGQDYTAIEIGGWDGEFTAVPNEYVQEHINVAEGYKTEIYDLFVDAVKDNGFNKLEFANSLKEIPTESFTTPTGRKYSLDKVGDWECNGDYVVEETVLDDYNELVTEQNKFTKRLKTNILELEKLNFKNFVKELTGKSVKKLTDAEYDNYRKSYIIKSGFDVEMGFFSHWDWTDIDLNKYDNEVDEALNGFDTDNARDYYENKYKDLIDFDDEGGYGSDELYAVVLKEGWNKVSERLKEPHMYESSDERINGDEYVNEIVERYAKYNKKVNLLKNKSEVSNRDDIPVDKIVSFDYTYHFYPKVNVNNYKTDKKTGENIPMKPEESISVYNEWIKELPSHEIEARIKLIPGKITAQEQVVMFYEKQVLPYIQSLRPDVKKVRDGAGNVWFETKLTDEDRGAVEAFKEFAPAFYSRLEREIEDIEGDNIKVQRLPNLLRNISQDEIKWSGLNDFVKDNAVNGRINKKAILDYLKENNTKVTLNFGMKYPGLNKKLKEEANYEIDRRKFTKEVEDDFSRIILNRKSTNKEEQQEYLDFVRKYGGRDEYIINEFLSNNTVSNETFNKVFNSIKDEWFSGDNTVIGSRANALDLIASLEKRTVDESVVNFITDYVSDSDDVYVKNNTAFTTYFLGSQKLSNEKFDKVFNKYSADTYLMNTKGLARNPYKTEEQTQKLYNLYKTRIQLGINSDNESAVREGNEYIDHLAVGGITDSIFNDIIGDKRVNAISQVKELEKLNFDTNRKYRSVIDTGVLKGDELKEFVQKETDIVAQRLEQIKELKRIAGTFTLNFAHLLSKSKNLTDYQINQIINFPFSQHELRKNLSATSRLPDDVFNTLLSSGYESFISQNKNLTDSQVSSVIDNLMDLKYKQNQFTDYIGTYLSKNSMTENNIRKLVDFVIEHTIEPENLRTTFTNLLNKSVIPDDVFKKIYYRINPSEINIDNNLTDEQLDKLSDYHWMDYNSKSTREDYVYDFNRIVGESEYDEEYNPNNKYIPSQYVEAVVSSNKSEDYSPDDVHFGDQQDSVSWFRGQMFNINNEKIFHIDEIQSKRHDKGKELGYWSDVKFERDTTDDGESYYGNWEGAVLAVHKRQYNDDGRKPFTASFDGRFIGYYDTADSAMRELQRRTNTIPPAPFEDYAPVTIKNILRYCAENQIDGIALTTPKQIKSLYNISEKVSKINSVDNGDGTFRLTFYDTGGHRMFDEDGYSAVTKDRITELIGESLANKIVNNEGKKTKPEFEDASKDTPPFYYKGTWCRINGVTKSNDGERILSIHDVREGFTFNIDKTDYDEYALFPVEYAEDDLEIGGEWADEMYGVKIPNFINKYMKKLGIKTQLVYKDVIGRGIVQPYLEIKGELANKVLAEGQPLFQKNPYQPMIDEMIKNTDKSELSKYFNHKNEYVREGIAKVANPGDLHLLLADDSPIVRDTLYGRVSLDELVTLYEKDEFINSLPALRNRLAEEMLKDGFDPAYLYRFTNSKDKLLSEVAQSVDFSDKKSIMRGAEKLKDINDMFGERGEEEIDESELKVDNAVKKSNEIPKDVEDSYSNPALVNIQNPIMESGYAGLSPEVKKDIAEDLMATNGTTEAHQLKSMLDAMGFVRTDREQELQEKINDKSKWKRIEGNKHAVKLSNRELDHFKIVNTALVGIKDIVGDDIHLVGGATRDLLMRNANITNKEVNDLDFSVPKYEQIEKINEYFKNHPDFGVDESGLKFSHIKVIHKASKYEFEFSSYRKEAYHDTSRKPDVVEGTFEDELKRRDFTINTIYAKIDDVTDDGVQLTVDDKTSEFIDDINKGIIRTYNDANIVFDEDPLRLLRALRFASRYGFEIDEVTQEAISNFDPDKFGKVSGERIRDEFTKVLRAGDDVFAFNIVAKVFPELSELYDQTEVLNHINRVVKLARKYDDNVLLWTALLHDVGKAKTATEGKPGEDGKSKVIHPGHAEESLKMIKPLLNRLKLSRQEHKAIEKLVGIHSKYKELDKMNMGKVIDFAIENESVFPYLIKFQDLDYFAHAGSFFNDYPEETNFNIIARMSGVYNLLKQIPSEEKEKWQGKEFKSKLKNYIANELKYKESYEAGAKALYKLYNRKEPVMSDECLAPNNKPSKLTNYQWKQVRTPEFNEFFGDWKNDPANASKVVDENGEPKVVLHGTTFDIPEFSTEPANMSNYFGKAIYFTDSVIDVNTNYAGIGPDLQHKIDSAYERIYDTIMDELYNDSEYFVEQYPLTNESDIEKYNMLKDTSNSDNRTKLFELLSLHAEQIATKMSEESVKGNNDGNVMPVYVDMKNPAVIDYLNPSKNTKFYLESEEDEDGNIIDTGNAMELSDAIIELGSEFNIDGNSLWYDLTNNFMDSFYNGVTLEEIDKAIRQSSFVMDAYDEEGNNLTSEFIRQVYEQLGYDGIIQSNVDRKFVGMKLPAKTNHYIAFKPTQVKSAIANKGTFDKSGNILHQGKSEETDGVKPLSISEIDEYSKKAYEMLQGIIPVTMEEMDRDNGKAVLDGLRSILAIDPRTANEGTFYHETFHIATEVLGDNKIWDVMLLQAGWDGEGRNDSWIEAQEKLADEFMNYVKEQKYKSKPVQLFDRLRTFFSKISGIFSKDKQYYKADYFYKLSKGKLTPKTVYDRNQNNYSVASNIAYQRNNSVPGNIKDKMVKTTLKSLGKNPSGKEILRGQGGMLNFNEDFFKHLKSDGVGKNEQEFIKFVIDNEKLADKKMSPEQFKSTLLSYLYPINIENSYEDIKVGMPDDLYNQYADQVELGRGTIKELYSNYQYENGKYYGYNGWGDDREELKENQVPDEMVDMLLTKWENARYSNYYGSGGREIGLQAEGGVGYRELKLTLPFDVLKSHPEFATDNMLGWYRVDTDETNSRRLRVNELQSDVFQKNNMPKEYKDLVVGDTFKYNGKNVVVESVTYSPDDTYVKGNDAIIVTNKASGNELLITKRDYDEFRNFGIDRAKHSMLIRNLQSTWHEYFIKSMIQNAYDSNFDEIMFPTGDTIGKIEGFRNFDEHIQKANNELENAEQLKKEYSEIQDMLVHRDRKRLEELDFSDLKLLFEDSIISLNGSPFSINSFKTKEQLIDFLLDAKYTEQLIKQAGYEIITAKDKIQSAKSSLRHYEDAEKYSQSVKDFYDKKIASYLRKLKKGNIEDYTDANGQTWLLAKLDANDGSPVELYQRKSFTKMFRLSMNGIKSVFERYIGGNVDYNYHWNRWFVDKDASSKPDVAHSILSNPELKNALVNNLFQSYKKMMEERTKILQDNPEAGLDVEDVSELTFEDFVNKDIKVYREKSADKELDGFDSWYLDKNVAIRNGNSDDIEEGVIKPSNTLGLMDNVNSNSQVLVPSGFTDDMYKDFSMSMMHNTVDGGIEISKDKLVEKFNKEKDWKNLYDRMIDIVYGKQQLNIGITPATKNVEDIAVLLQKSEEFFKKDNFNKVKEYNAKVLEFGKNWFEQKFQNKVNAVVDVSDSIGLFGGWMEPTMDMNISFDYADKGDILSSIIDFANDFKQSNVHVSKRLVSIPETAEIGVVTSDGSTFQENYQINFKKSLTKAQINNLTKKFDEFNLPGFTINEKNDSIVFYNITTDGVKGYEQFWEGTAKLFNYVESLPIFESKEQDFRQLWNWGDTEFGATAGFEEARSQVFSKAQKEDITLEKNFISELDKVSNNTDIAQIGVSTKVKVSANTEFEITPMGNKQVSLAVYSNGNYIGEDFLFESDIVKFKETFNKIAEKKHEILHTIQTEEPDNDFPFMDELKSDSFLFVDGTMFYVDTIDDNKKNMVLCEIGNDGVLLSRKKVSASNWEKKFSGIKVSENATSVLNVKSLDNINSGDELFLPTLGDNVKIVGKDNYGVDCVTNEGRKVNISSVAINKMSLLTKLSETIESKIPEIHFGESDYAVTSLLNDKPYRMLPTFGSGAGNTSYFCSDAEGKKLALFKPSAMETASRHQLGIDPGTQYVREVVSSYVDKLFGFDLVPTTVFKKVNGMVGSYQKFIGGSVSMAEYVDSKFDKVRVDLDKQAENMSKGLGVSLGSHMDEIIKDKNNNLIIDDMAVEFGLQMTPELRATLSQSLDRLKAKAKSAQKKIRSDFQKSESYIKLYLLDYVIGNGDRHSENVLIDKDENIHAIDNGYAMADNRGLSWFKDGMYVGMEEIMNLRESEHEGVRTLWKNLTNPKNMEKIKEKFVDTGVLGKDEFKGLLSRVANMIRAEGVFYTYVDESPRSGTIDAINMASTDYAEYSVEEALAEFTKILD